MQFPHLPVTSNAGITQNFEHLQRLLTKTRGTSFPLSPTDGQEYDYIADAINGVIWRFRYRAASASTHKWEFVGGGVLQSRTDGNNSKLVTLEKWETFAESPKIIVPLAGDYEAHHSAQTLTASGSNPILFIGIAVGVAEPAVTTEALGNESAVVNSNLWLSLTCVLTNVKAGEPIEQRYRSSVGATMEVVRRHLLIRPIRVG